MQTKNFFAIANSMNDTRLLQGVGSRHPRKKSPLPVHRCTKIAALSVNNYRPALYAHSVSSFHLQLRAPIGKYLCTCKYSFNPVPEK